MFVIENGSQLFPINYELLTLNYELKNHVGITSSREFI